MKKRREFILKVVCCFYGLELSKLQIYLLTELCCLYYNSRISLTTFNRRKIKNYLGTSYATFTNTLRVLEDKNIIEKQGKIDNTTLYFISNSELEMAVLELEYKIEIE